MKNIAIRRLRLLPVPKGAGVSARRQLVMLSEFAKMGVRVTNPECLAQASDTLFLDYQGFVDTLSALKGGDVDYVPLFVGFPDQVPEDDAYFCKRIIGYLGNALQRFPEGTELENGIVVPDWLFELREFGADPITQFQTESLWQRAKRVIGKRAVDAHTEWLDVQFVWADEVQDRLRDWLHSCLYAGSSIKEALHADIAQLLQWFGTDAIDFDRVIMKENQALVLRLLWNGGDESAAVALARTPTDVLRLFAALTESDVSLSKPIQFPKLSRRQRRYVLSALERSSALAEDLRRYRGLWLEIGRYIHPGEYRRGFPNTWSAFDALRNGTIETFNGRTELLMRQPDARLVLGHLRGRPGVFGRKLHELLRRFPNDTDAIMDAFRELSGAMTAKNLLVLERYFASIDDAEYRTVINKRGKIKVVPNNAKHRLTDDQRMRIAQLLAQALQRQFETRDSWAEKSVWIDPQLTGYTVPLQQRAASDGVQCVGRGSRIPVSFDKVLRLFVYWKQAQSRTDLDLSVIQFDDVFKYAGHVSYTNLAANGIVHSGDLQSAPHGAAEFIDITLDAIGEGVRYLAVQVHRYAGDEFAKMPCHAGWMIRESVDSRYKSFDIKTVANKFDLTGTGGYCVPFVVDLKSREMVMVDLYMGNKAFHNNVEGSYGNVALACREIARFTHTRPTLDRLALLHAQARAGRIVDDKDDAEITFGVSDCTYNATDVETVLSQLL